MPTHVAVEDENRNHDINAQERRQANGHSRLDFCSTYEMNVCIGCANENRRENKYIRMMMLYSTMVNHGNSLQETENL